MKILRNVFAAAVLSSTAWTAHAAGSPEVVVDLQVRKVTVQKDGTESLVDAAAGPGETLEYRATYTNRGAAVARSVLATLPVPEAGVEYVDASAVPGKVMASVDGKQFAPAPLQRVVTLPDGSRKSEPVPPSEYRYLRWNLGDLDAGKSTVVRSRMRLTGPLR
nr:hypothetical protein [uncultured Noviherbaspirillum sp.]